MIIRHSINHIIEKQRAENTTKQNPLSQSDVEKKTPNSTPGFS